MRACCRALAALQDIELTVVAFASRDSSAPFRSDLTAGDQQVFLLSPEQQRDAAAVARLVSARRPDVVVVPGWAYHAYRRLLGNPELRHARFVMTMDTPFRGTWRQAVGRMPIGAFARRMDHVVVAGERSWQYARYLGVPEQRITRGVYGYDDELFRPALEWRREVGEWPRKFIYVGRYAEEKSIGVLLAGYRAYRASVPDPWPLSCCGNGPLGADIRAEPGVTDLGFVQPEAQPRVLAAHGAFVIASRYEPWGVAIAEAAGSGLPVICTEACGAGLDVVRSHYNGLVVPTGDPAALAAAMGWMHANYPRLPELGERSRESATAYTATAWAERWAAFLRAIL
jgi:glycosyltransferase involved in cell wall biosynthesis